MESVGSAEILAERVRAVLDRPITVKRMFSGLTFMLEGNMLCCVSTKGLMVRVGAAAESEALKRPLVARCLGAGRPMAGFLLVDPQGRGRRRRSARVAGPGAGLCRRPAAQESQAAQDKIAWSQGTRSNFQENSVTQLAFDPPLFTVFSLVVLILGLKALILGAATAATRGALSSFSMRKMRNG